jgi:hypothetical protein
MSSLPHPCSTTSPSLKALILTVLAADLVFPTHVTH